MSLPDGIRIAFRVQSRLGLQIEGSVEEWDGGRFIALRPTDLPRPNGFGVIIAVSPRRVEASFRADSFSKGLLKTMGQSDSNAKMQFREQVLQAINIGYRVHIAANGAEHSSADLLPQGDWQSFDVELDRLLPQGKKTDAIIEAEVVEVAARCLGLITCLLPIEEIAENLSDCEPGLPEGAKIRVEVNKYERSPGNRNACIAFFGPICQVCGFKFFERYGEIGTEYIEVHHKVPVSSMNGEYRLNPVTDLVPVCSNCHSMLHRKSPPYSIEELKEMIAARSK